MREYVVQSLLHALVAAAVIEALVRAWRLVDPVERLAYRLLVLTLPLVLPPIFGWLAPFRLQPAFADTRALFASSHWQPLTVAGVPLEAAAAAAAAVAGVALFVRDVRPLVASGRRGHHPRPAGPDDGIGAVVAEVAPRLGLARPPRVRRLVTSGPVLYTSGVWRPEVIVSTGALERLDAQQRRAAVAHELAHVSRHDLLLGWAVMLTRTFLVHNPIVQVVARAAVQEMERSADDLAARVTGSPEALAGAMAALARPRPAAGAARAVGIGPFDDFLAELLTRGRAVAFEARQRRLLDGWPPRRSPLAAARFALAAVATTTLLFFVV